MRYAVRLLLVQVLLGLGASVPSALAAPRLVVAVGDPSPFGLPFSRVSDPALDDRGRVAFIGASAAIFQRLGGQLTHLAAAGDTILGRVLADAGAPDIDESGCLAFRALFVDGGAAVVRRCGGVFEAVAEAGQAAPGGMTFVGFGPEVAVGRIGHVLFVGLLSDGRSGLFATDAGAGLVEIARVGAPSPAGGTFTALRPVGISDAGVIGFRGTVSFGHNGLFFWNGGILAKLVVAGEAAPVGGSFTDVGLASLNGAGAWAFRAALSSDASNGVFRARLSDTVPALEAVAIGGQATPLGGTFRDFPSSLVPSINRAGTVAFRAVLDGATRDGIRIPSAVFTGSPTGTLASVVATGEITQVGQLLRLREVEVADDGSTLVRATLLGGRPGIFRAQNGLVQQVAILGDATDLGSGFRWASMSVAGPAAGAVFRGLREGLFVSSDAGEPSAVATLGETTPVGGVYAGFDAPAAGGGRILFGADVQEGRVGEALFSVGRRRVAAAVRVGTRLAGGGAVDDLFSDPLDGLARAGVGRGTVAFQARLSGVGGETGVVVAGGRRPRVVAVQGRSAPGGGAYTAFGTPAALGAGRVAFVAERTRASAQALILSGRGASRMVAQVGDTTGTRLAGRYRTIGTPAAVAGGVVFEAGLSGGPAKGIFHARGRRRSALVATGEFAPGGGELRDFGGPVGAGAEVVFRAEMRSGPTARGLYRVPLAGGEPSALTAVAEFGAPAPGGGTYVDFGSPAGNRAGAVAFSADLVGAATAGAIVLDQPE